MEILLMGNPNVGKSALFSRLSGINVSASNYPGTTVEIKKGKIVFSGTTAKLIDVPGIYSLEANSKAEKSAVKMLKKADVIINVVDSTNLERNLFLTMELLEKQVPMIIALNFWDETESKGIKINAKKLEHILKIPVVPTSAITGFGIKKLVSKIDCAKKEKYPIHNNKYKWEKIGEIIHKTQSITNEKKSLPESMKNLTMKPITGIPFAILVLLIVFFLIRFIGEGLITIIFDPLFGAYLPIAEIISNTLGEGIIRDILIGKLVGGKIDFVQSMGLLTTGIYVPLAMVLPYVFSFYLTLGIIEDSGYLPRLATLLDNIMHKVGLHGLSIIPMILGLGCNVPGALATRVLENKRQRFIAITLMAIAIPCMAQIAMLIGLLGKYGVEALAIVFLTLFMVWIILGFIMNKTLKGDSPEIFMEIPPYRIPYWKSVAKKLGMRTNLFIREAIPFVLLGVLLINFFYATGIIAFFGKIAAPIIVNLLGLPEEAVVALLAGFLRKDIAIGMLLPLGLNMKQLIISSVILTMYFPCIGTFAVIFKELGLKDTIKSVIIMLSTTLITGIILAIVL